MEYVYWLLAVVVALLLFVSFCDISYHSGSWSPLSLDWDKKWVRRTCRFIMLIIIPILMIAVTALLVSTGLNVAPVLTTIFCLGVSIVFVVLVRLVAIMLWVILMMLIEGIVELFKFVFA